MFAFGQAQVLMLVDREVVQDASWPRVADLVERCRPRLTEDPSAATVIIALGDPENWPLLVDAVPPGALAWVWFRALAEPELYQAALEQLPEARFCHGADGLERLEGLLVEVGALEEGALPESDFFVQLRAEYLENLERELKMLRRAALTLGPPRLQTWSRFLLGVVASAGAYEFPLISEAASEAVDVLLTQRRRPEGMRQALDLIQKALRQDKDHFTRVRQERLPALIELEGDHRVLWLSTQDALVQETRQVLAATGLELQQLPDPSSLLDTLDLVQPAALLIDQNLGHFDGLDVVAQLRALVRFEALPILALLGQSSEEARLRAIQGHVDRWLTYPFQARDISMSLLQMLRRQEVMQRLGGREALSGLYTREALKDRLRAELLRAQRSGQTLALMLIRIHTGDEERENPRHLFGLLTEIAQHTFRRSDVLARHDPHTLAAGLPECDARVVLALGKRLTLAAPEGVSLHIAASLGDGSTSPNMLLADAEARLRAAMAGKPAAAVGHCVRSRTAEAPRASMPRVMLVDTDEAILNLLRFFCAREGFQVNEARDGNSALEIIDADAAQGLTPDVVILEAHLPGMDGFQVLEALQERYGARVAVILMSVQHSGERVSRAFQLGAVDFIGKPFNVPEVVARVRNALVRAGAM